MHDNRTHPLLQQVPLTVSPFVQLPTAITLPYTYKTMPSALPPSALGISTDDPAAAAKPKFVISASGEHAAHPDDIIASCQELRAHLDRLQATAAADLRAFEERIRARELAEKRRLAPGWLDSDARLLQPERRDGDGGTADAGAGAAASASGTAGRGSAEGTSGHGHGHGPGGESEMAVPDDEGAELDRVFGSMALEQR